MNKKLKKLITLCAAVLLLLGVLPTTAFAANESLPPDKGTLIIHKYLMDDVSKAGDPNDGREATNVPDEAKPLDGITFDVYPVVIPTDGETEGIYPESGTVTITPSLTAPTSFFDGTNTFTLGAKAGSQTTAGGGLATFADLPRGIYLVVEQNSDLVASPAAPFVVAVPMTDPEEDGWLSEVHVYPKNEDMSIEKEINIPSITVGELIEFTLTPSVPSDVGTALKYDIVDTLDSALDYQTNPALTVKGAATKEALDSASMFTLATDYTVSYDESTRKLTVSFDEDQRKKLQEAGYRFLEITFSTKVNEDILNKELDTAKNTASIDFTNQYDQDNTYKSNEVEVHTGSIDITKVDAQTKAPIITADAKFKIASSEQNALAGIYLKKDADGNILNYGDPGYTEELADYEVTTDDTGRALFEGLKCDYVDEEGAEQFMEYWLVETQAPDGYNLLNAPVKVTMGHNEDPDSDAPYTVGIEIENNKGFILPKTGGAGTLLFTVGGIVLIGIASLLILTMHRRKATNE